MTRDDIIHKLAPTPDWLTKAWARAKQSGLDTLTPDEIDAEIAAHRAEAAQCNGDKE